VPGAGADGQGAVLAFCPDAGCCGSAPGQGAVPVFCPDAGCGGAAPGQGANCCWPSP